MTEPVPETRRSLPSPPRGQHGTVEATSRVPASQPPAFVDDVRVYQ